MGELFWCDGHPLVLQLEALITLRSCNTRG